MFQAESFGGYDGPKRPGSHELYGMSLMAKVKNVKRSTLGHCLCQREGCKGRRKLSHLLPTIYNFESDSDD